MIQIVASLPDDYRDVTYAPGVFNYSLREHL